MKQKTALFLAVCILGAMLAGCGQKDSASDGSKAGASSSGVSSSTPAGGSSQDKSEDGAQSGSSQSSTPPETAAPASTAGTEEVDVLEYDGVEYARITYSGFLDSDRGDFDFGDGDVRNWAYVNVAAGSTCTITPTPSDAYKYAMIEIETYEQEDGVYSSVPWGLRHRLYADGQAEDIVIGDELDRLPLPTADHPAYFIFGKIRT